MKDFIHSFRLLSPEIVREKMVLYVFAVHCNQILRFISIEREGGRKKERRERGKRLPSVFESFLVLK